MFNKSTRPPKTSYAFSQPNTASSSSSAIRQQLAETFYKPLPHTTNANANTNAFADPGVNSRDYASRTPSPNASRPLLAGASPIGNNLDSPTMAPNPSRSYATPNRVGGGAEMPQRGESQNALLGNGAERQVSEANLPFIAVWTSSHFPLCLPKRWHIEPR